MPLDNVTPLKGLGKLVLIHTGPIPIEFTQLDNNKTSNYWTNIRRITMNILLDHKDEGITFKQLFNEVVEYTVSEAYNGPNVAPAHSGWTKHQTLSRHRKLRRRKKQHGDS